MSILGSLVEDAFRQFGNGFGFPCGVSLGVSLPDSHNLEPRCCSDVARQDGATYASCVEACKKGVWDQALSLLSLMGVAGLRRCRIQLTAAMDCCSAAESWEVALLWTFRTDADTATWDPAFGTSSLAAMAKGHKWRWAIGTLSSLPDVLIQPNTIISSAALSACERSGQWQMALLTLLDMLELRILPNQISFGTAIQACEKNDRWQLLTSLIAMMGTCALLPNSVVYAAVQAPRSAVPMFVETLSQTGDIVTLALQSQKARRMLVQ